MSQTFSKETHKLIVEYVTFITTLFCVGFVICTICMKRTHSCGVCVEVEICVKKVCLVYIIYMGDQIDIELHIQLLRGVELMYNRCVCVCVWVVLFISKKNIRPYTIVDVLCGNLC